MYPRLGSNSSSCQSLLSGRMTSLRPQAQLSPPGLLCSPIGTELCIIGSSFLSAGIRHVPPRLPKVSLCLSCPCHLRDSPSETLHLLLPVCICSVEVQTQLKCKQFGGWP